MTDQVGYYWNNGNWQINSRDSFSYNLNNQWTNFLFQVWNGSNWTNSWQYVYSYDPNFNNTSMLFQTWTNNNWTNNTKYDYTYDMNNACTSFVSRTWNNAWNNMDSTHYYYHFSTGVAEGYSAGDCKIFPNPSGSEFNIDMSAIFRNDISVEVLDITGRSVFTQRKVNAGILKLDNSGWEPGTYIVNIRSGNSIIERKKIIVMR
jgi:hypothetical protein